jgi:DNA repair protein SbcC/Rad50
MRIVSLTLENIKSYGESTVISFTGGLNAVSGQNGAGKTTVLEAIGFALFDYLPYPQGAFVREGQKTGTVRVRIVAPDDREYEVVRRVGSSSAWWVSDVETEVRLAERGESVKLWIRTQLLDVEGDIDLAALFQNAVGVPQGTMTGDFLRTAATRKGVFDPLLRVEEYRGAWENLRETLNYLRDRAGDLREEIGRLEGETERIADVEANEASLRVDLSENERALANLHTELERLAVEKSELDRREAAVQAAAGAVLGVEYDVRRHADRVRESERKRDEARSARAAVAASRDGYELFSAAQHALRTLEADRQQRDGLTAALAKVKGELDGTVRQIERVTLDLRCAREDEVAAAALGPNVEQQTAIEERIAAIQRRIEERTSQQAVLAGVEREAQTHQAAIDVAQRRIGDALAAADESVALEGVAAELRGVETALGALDGLETQRDEVRARGETLRQRVDARLADARRADELTAAMADLRPLAEGLQAARQAHDALHERYIRVDATLAYQDVARAELAEHQCPLLQLECPVVAADGRVLVRFDRHVAEMTADRDGLERELAEARSRLERSEGAAARLQSLQLDHAPLASAQAQLAELQPELERCRGQYRELDERLKGKSALETRRAALDKELRRLEERRTLAASLPALQEQRAAAEAALAAVRDRERELRDELARAASLYEQLAVEREALRTLENPREAQTRLLVSAAKIPELEVELERERARQIHETEQFNEIREQLHPYETLDARIKEQHGLQETHRPAYETYLRYSEEAAGLEDCERAVAEAEALLREAEVALTVATTARDEATAAYDAARHAGVTAEYQEAYAVAATCASQGDRLRADLARVERDLRDLRAKRDRLNERRDEQEELARVSRTVEFIRDTIRAAGPAVTELLLTTISQEASDIFAEIMDDHTSELRWENDYEVVVQRGAESRSFSQLSGGEQMSAALAVRLALLREMSEVDFAFFDEPTQNMDMERRTNLAAQIGAIRGFDQLIVISHDDTFEHQTDNLIRLTKERDSTRVDSA